MTMRDMKPILEREPNRKALASAINAHAGARRDLQVAEQAAEVASDHLWKAQAGLDRLRDAGAAQSGSMAEKFIGSVASGTPCDTAVLERSSIDAREQITAAETDIQIWQATLEECKQAVFEKGLAAADAKDNVAKAAREVIANSETVTRLSDELANLQADIVSRRSVLRFIWGKALNGELDRSLSEKVERLLWQDLMGMEPTPASVAWAAAFDALMTDSDSELPTEFEEAAS
jgi:hypothetical protein